MFPSPRLDFYACVQARKRLDSPYGKDTVFELEGSVNPIEGANYKPKYIIDDVSKEKKLAPYY